MWTGYKAMSPADTKRSAKVRKMGNLTSYQRPTKRLLEYVWSTDWEIKRWGHWWLIAAVHSFVDRRLILPSHTITTFEAIQCHYQSSFRYLVVKCHLLSWDVVLLNCYVIPRKPCLNQSNIVFHCTCAAREPDIWSQAVAGERDFTIALPWANSGGLL